MSSEKTPPFSAKQSARTFAETAAVAGDLQAAASLQKTPGETLKGDCKLLNIR
ncbi:hypothetical protein LCGC14_0016250 [marine sediment metagenome]|uniref:Uncharacterized protein n=1 Tax=marine sediment metagenome TaxID=412755 RepID=A0A0F9Z210_9ZZZZ